MEASDRKSPPFPPEADEGWAPSSSLGVWLNLENSRAQSGVTVPRRETRKRAMQRTKSMRWKTVPDSADSVRNDGAGEAQKASQRESGPERRVGNWSRESETAGPVMRRAPRLKVRYSKPHWMKTRTRLWNSTMYIR